MNERKKTSLMIQVVILFIVGILVMLVFSYFSARNMSDVSVRSEIEHKAINTGTEAEMCIKDFPTYAWVIDYCYNHEEDMDIEYDVDYTTGKKTEKKCKQLIEHNPGFQIEYADVDDVKALSKDDQKLYAEIVYSWITTRLNEIKRSNEIDFLFCILTDESCKEQYFVFSGADEGAVRGEDYEEIYPLGKIVKASDTQIVGMKGAIESDTHIASAGKYLDYYAYLDTIGDKIALLGMSYSTADFKNATWTQTRRDIFMNLLIQILLAIVCMALLYQVALKPLKEVQESIRTYKETKDSGAVEDSLKNIVTRNEIGELKGDIIDLTKEIDNHVNQIEKITAREERIAAELDMSRRIQASMIPNTYPAFPERDEFDVYAIMEPAREVGGDFYDFFLIDKDHLGIIIADVSGKGIPAALFMMASKIIFQSIAMLGGKTEDILNRANDAICSSNPYDMFVTAWVGILEIPTGKIIAANAGHEYPVVRQNGGSFKLVKDKHGFVVGGIEGASYESYEIQLEPGDKIFVYTDGVPEAADADKNMFGLERMLSALNEDVNASPEQTIDNIKAAVSAFTKDAEQFDDTTMLCLEYKGNK